MHAVVALGNSVIELADANEQIPAAPMAIHLYFDDADSFFARAIEAGATSIYEVGDHVSGDRQGAVRDPFGNLWYIAMIQGWTPGPEGVPSVQPYLHLHGSEKMIPFLENAFGGGVLGDVPLSPEGHVLHATIQIGDNTLEVDEAHGEFQPMPCHLHLHVDETRRALNRPPACCLQSESSRAARVLPAIEARRPEPLRQTRSPEMESSFPNHADAGTAVRLALPPDPESILGSSRCTTNFRTDLVPLPAGRPRRGPRRRKWKSHPPLSLVRRTRPHRQSTNEWPRVPEAPAHLRPPVRSRSSRGPLPRA